VVSEMAIGFDGMLNFYKNRNDISDLAMEKAFLEHSNWNEQLSKPYFVNASSKLLNLVGEGLRKGVTISAPGFYGPQGRVLRLETADMQLNEKISAFRYNDAKITNYEMECSAIYGLSALLGHNALTICNIIANRIRGEYSADYKVSLEKLIVLVLDRLSKLE